MVLIKLCMNPINPLRAEKSLPGLMSHEPWGGFCNKKTVIAGQNLWTLNVAVMMGCENQKNFKTQKPEAEWNANASKKE